MLCWGWSASGVPRSVVGVVSVVAQYECVVTNGCVGSVILSYCRHVIFSVV